ncbi:MULTISPECIES: hypothetical protein [unclassified Microcoleus]|uniref:hypothetical protein n=1 Tax=unclassified Microcoleus TaxID=2642155 RepID=UPI002FD29C21
MQHIFTFTVQMPDISGMGPQGEGRSGDRIGGEKPGFFLYFSRLVVKCRRNRVSEVRARGSKDIRKIIFS